MIDSEKIMSHWNIQPNPFDKISPFLFADIVHDAIKRSQCIIIFVEEHLCTEYVGVKDDFGSPYQNLRQGVIGKRVRYIPAATEPYETISNILIPHQENVFYLHSGVKLQADNSLKYLYIFFQDYYNATQVQSLRNHDYIMNDVYNTISKSKKKSGPIVAFYTGKVSPIPVEEVEFDPVKPDDVPSDMGVLVRAEGAMFRLSETWTDQTISTTISYTDFELLFNFRVEYNEWLLGHNQLVEVHESFKTRHHAESNRIAIIHLYLLE
ncbi:putative vacuolar ATP synthase subunit S1 [Operophtera brumata]|uniref:Putative vacuolar ATP synthase subunit S1 n=1 Tax=Operophtera brumata TaxID=104452 RepID=A0A0L7KWC7_OPEBR|nr:putative vacuolar ATP synthase subunit S1 [Operophtera brumata]